jgi:hypothetical protein
MESLSKLEDYQLQGDKQYTKVTSSKLDAVHFRARYTMNGEMFKQITYVLDCGCGVKYLFTFTTSHAEMTSEPVFMLMLENALFRRIRDLPWSAYNSSNCRIEYPQLWNRQSNGSTLFFFSPIQLVSQNRITDNVVVQYITNGNSLEVDIEQLYQQLAEKENFKAIKDIRDDCVCKCDAKFFEVEYDYNGKHLIQVTYLVKHGDCPDNKKWMISYTSVGGQSRSLFDEIIRRFQLKQM